MDEQSAEAAAHSVGSRIRELARRIRLLQDVVSAKRGSPYTYSEVQQAVAADGVNLSERRWSYLVNGDSSLTTDEKLLTALAKTFEVDPEYLISWTNTELPKSVEAYRDMVVALRQAKVVKFATRTFGELTPESMKAIQKLVESQAQSDFKKSEESL